MTKPRKGFVLPRVAQQTEVDLLTRLSHLSLRPVGGSEQKEALWGDRKKLYQLLILAYSLLLGFLKARDSNSLSLSFPIYK